MKCVICRHGETRDGFATFTIVREALTMVVNQVPARVCDNCGEEYFSEEVARQLYSKADELAHSGAQVEIREYKAA
jgi:YgiT-type zinc finger domain-containing protein